MAFEPGQCFSLIKRYKTASRNYSKFDIDVLGAVEFHGTKCPIVAVKIGAGRKKVLVAAGIHGDEKAAPEALVRFIEDPKTPRFLRGFSLTLLPLLNPIGFAKNIRKNGSIDLNRHFGCRKHHAENSLVEGYLYSRNYGLMISLHEDVDKDSFYMYETGSFDARKLGKIIVDDAIFMEMLKKKGIRINAEKSMYGMLNRGGIKIVPHQKGRNLERYLWSKNIAKRVVCIESPGKIDFEKRVGIHSLALKHFLKGFLV